MIFRARTDSITIGREGNDVNFPEDLFISGRHASIAIAADVSRVEDVRAIIDGALERFGRIDIVHNNVGIGALGGAVELSESDWSRVIDTNLKSMFLTCKHVLPVMEKQGGGARRMRMVRAVAAIGWRWRMDSLDWPAGR